MQAAVAKAGYPSKADPAAMNRPLVIGILVYLVLLVTAVYGPIAALLVEIFPSRIRYTSMSLPYHIGNGWFGGFLPTTAFAMVAATGDIYYGLWYPVLIAGLTAIVGLLFLPETFKRCLRVFEIQIILTKTGCHRWPVFFFVADRLVAFWPLRL